MTLINCPECKRGLSDKALALKCPHCGSPVEKLTGGTDTMSDNVRNRPRGRNRPREDKRKGIDWAGGCVQWIILIIVIVIGYNVWMYHENQPMDYLSAPLLLWVGCIILGMVIGANKGDIVRGFVWTFLIGPIGLIVVLASPAKSSSARQSSSADPRGELSPEVSAAQPTHPREPEPSSASPVLLVVGGLVLAASLAAFVAGMSTSELGHDAALWPIISVPGVGLGLVLLAAGVLGRHRGRR